MKTKLTILAILLACAPLPAQTWNNTGTDFNAAGSWTGGAPGSGDTGVFSSPATNQPGLSANITVGGLDFQYAGYTLSGAFDLTVGNAGIASSGAGTNIISSGLKTANSSSATWDIATGNTLSLVGTLTQGTASVIHKTGAGVLELNSASGIIASNMIISGGTVRLLTPRVASALTISNGATLEIGYATNVSSLVVPITLGAGGGVIDSTNTGVTRIDSYFDGSGDLTLRRVAGNFLQINSTSSRASTNTGRTIIESGTIRITGSYAIGDNSVVSISNGATLQVRNSEIVGGLSGAGTVTSFGATNALTIGGSGSNENFSGVLKDDTAANTLALVKNGAGTQTLSGVNGTKIRRFWDENLVATC